MAMRLDRNSYGLASCERIELADLDSEEPKSKKVKLDPKVVAMKTRSKGKEVPRKTKEELHKEASEQWESIEEAHI